MHPLSGPYLIAMSVLALGGLLKVVRPADTANAMRAMNLPASEGLARLMGIGEISIAFGAVIVPGPVLPTVAGLAYIAFTMFVAAALLRRIPIQSCGCFGRVDTPPSLAHVVVNLAAATTAFAFAATAHQTIASQLSEHAKEAVPLLALSGVGVYLVYAALTALPETLAEVRNRGAA